MNKSVGQILSTVAMGSVAAFVIEGIIGRILLGSVFRRSFQSSTDRQANRYFPVQAPSEIAAGHPLVGVS